ncbi:leucine--tRNA ligase [Candidatus Pacearchaeota archaeon]|nr:leucine--tRNA ligase [Candidatus Pacearchaeota archaeon]
MAYNFQSIEKKWQKTWEQKKAFQAKENSKKKKYYVLEMFPYPSGSGLHMGHAFNYIMGDVYARFMRMKGFNVLYAMGYDSFGLPAENAAIKAGIHPRKFTEDAIKNFIKQQKSLGLSYDWKRMLKTSDYDYYKWNQYLFLKFYERGLVYRKKSGVNFCSKCDTVLANEQVKNGRCWRHEDTEVEIKQLEQWFIKTTEYADELLDNIPKLDWPERIKTMQENWIGKSEGAEILFEVENTNNKISNVVIVHGSADDKNDKEYNKHWMIWIKKILEEKGIKVFAPNMPEPWGSTYMAWKKEFEKISNNINENSILIGHSRGTAFLVKWLGETGKKIKKLILVAPWKIADKKYKESFYDYKINDSVRSQVKDIVIFTSNDEEKDGKKSAKVFHDSLGGKLIELKDHGHYVLEDMGTKEFPELLNEISLTEKWPIFTTRPDTVFGVTFMVVSAQHSKLYEIVSAKQKKEVDEFLRKIRSTKQEDMDKLEKEGVFTGSYAINPMNNEKIPIYAGNFVVADYGSGMIMAVPAHDQRDFEFAKKYNLKIKEVISGGDIAKEAYTGAGKLINSKEFNDLDSEEAKEHIIKALEYKKLGKKTVQYKLRDWLVSRQRYWGTPIPMVYCAKCGIVPVPEKDLPVKLPEKVKFGKGNPLETDEKWVNVKCPKCGKLGRRETDTMDTFFDSSWYYLRYCDNKNKKKPFDKKKVDYWMPLDQYIGGAEHAVMHLIYARFFIKVLRDMKMLNVSEPFAKLFNQGMLHGEDGFVMSKSRGNVVLPEEISGKYGIDTARIFLMSMAFPDKDIQWSDSGIEGSYRFVKKFSEGVLSLKLGKSSNRLESKVNKTIKNVTEDIMEFRYNIAIIKLRQLYYFIEQSVEVSRKDLESFLKMLSIYAPHICEELWRKLENKKLISLADWPFADEGKIDANFEREEELVESLVNDLNNVKKFVENAKKAYAYIIPQDLGAYAGNFKEIEKRINLRLSIFAVNDSKKYDPQGKSKKAKPGKPGIYLE